MALNIDPAVTKQLLEQKLRAHQMVAPRLSHKRDMFAAEAAVKHCVYGKPFPVVSWARSSTAQQIRIAYDDLTKKALVTGVAKAASVPASKPSTKGSRYPNATFTLVDPSAASPSYNGYRARAYELCKTMTGETNTPVTVSNYLANATADPKLKNVGFDFLRFYERMGLITIVGVPASQR